MDLKTPFDDDSHTLHDGPLPRFFRMRKWFFATGLALLLIETGWWDYGTTASALALEDLPRDAVHVGATLTGLYLIIQAGLVATQIAATYPNTIVTRSKLIRSAAAHDLLQRADRIESSLRERLGPQRFAELASTYDEEFDGGRAQAYRIASFDRKEVDFYLTASGYRSEANRLESKQVARRLVLNTEVALDVIRIVPTLGFLLYSLAAHGTITPLLS